MIRSLYTGWCFCCLSFAPSCRCLCNVQTNRFGHLINVCVCAGVSIFILCLWFHFISHWISFLLFIFFLDFFDYNSFPFWWSFWLCARCFTVRGVFDFISHSTHWITNFSGSRPATCSLHNFTSFTCITNTRGVRSKLKIISFFLRSKEMHFHVNRKNRKPKLFHFFVWWLSLKAFFRRHSTQRYTIIIIFCKQSRINKTRIERSRTVNDHKRIHLKRRARAWNVDCWRRLLKLARSTSGRGELLETVRAGWAHDRCV